MLKSPDQRLYLEDLYVGQRFTSAPHLLDAEQIKTFAAQFDPQPFHLSDEGAAGSMFGTLAASGWHTMAITMRLLVESVPLADGVIEPAPRWPGRSRPGREWRFRCSARSSTSARRVRSRTWRSPCAAKPATSMARWFRVFTAKMPVFKRPQG